MPADHSCAIHACFTRPDSDLATLDHRDAHHNRNLRTIIHLNTRTLSRSLVHGNYINRPIDAAVNRNDRTGPLPRSDNPSQKNPDQSFASLAQHSNQYAYPDAPKPIHPDKEQFCSSTIKLGEQTSDFHLRLTFAGTNKSEKSKLDFPRTNKRPRSK
jgi:hypothetical protein